MLSEKYTGEYIKYEDCKEGCLYEVCARNIGPYSFFVEGKFHGPRYKFGWRMDSELHWDKDEYYGTVKPIRRIE